jgi:outer membrane protein W
MLFNAFVIVCQAQPYLTKKTKYRFAQGSMGIDFLYIPATGQGALLDTNGNYKFQFGGNTIPRLVIGGTHFWGHVDFALNFPVGSIGEKKDSLSRNTQFDIITTKYYPWAIKKNKLRPFVGSSCNVNLYKQSGANAYSKYWIGTDFYLNLPINFGASYQVGNLLWSADAKYLVNTNRKIYSNKAEIVHYQLPNYGIAIGVKKLFESTVKPFEKKYQDGTMAKEYGATKNKLNAFSFGVGLSSSFYLRQSAFNKTNRPYLNKNMMANFIPEFGVGYYLDKQDVHFNIAYRNIEASSSGFGLRQIVQRKAMTAEAFKFLFDYKGFVPFLGVGLSREQLFFTEADDVANYKFTSNGLVYSPSIITGWDIRYHRNYFFMLRTNIRYSPFLQLDTKSIYGKIKMQQLEVNFIQAVFYPQRLIAKIKKQKQVN